MREVADQWKKNWYKPNYLKDPAWSWPCVVITQKEHPMEQWSRNRYTGYGIMATRITLTQEIYDTLVKTTTTLTSVPATMEQSLPESDLRTIAAKTAEFSKRRTNTLPVVPSRSKSVARLRASEPRASTDVPDEQTDADAGLDQTTNTVNEQYHIFREQAQKMSGILCVSIIMSQFGVTTKEEAKDLFEDANFALEDVLLRCVCPREAGIPFRGVVTLAVHHAVMGIIQDHQALVERGGFNDLDGYEMTSTFASWSSEVIGVIVLLAAVEQIELDTPDAAERKYLDAISVIRNDLPRLAKVEAETYIKFWMSKVVTYCREACAMRQTILYGKAQTDKERAEIQSTLAGGDKSGTLNIAHAPRTARDKAYTTSLLLQGIRPGARERSKSRTSRVQANLAAARAAWQPTIKREPAP